MRQDKTKENVISKEISLSIKEGKWLHVVYDSLKEKRNTSFWCFVNDIDPEKKRLFVTVFNEFKGTDTIDLTLAYERILDAKVLSFTTGNYNENLVKKINDHLKEFSWLKFENFNNNILQYLEKCCEADSDPYIKDYAMVKGIDASTLEKEKELELNDAQIHQLVRYVIRQDLNEWENKKSELALSRLSIDDGPKKYIVAYQNIFFSPKDKKIKIKGGLKINQSFLIEGVKHSLYAYTELSASEFKESLINDFEGTLEILRQGISSFEKIDTRPDFFCLQRDFQLNLAELFGKIETRWNENTLNAPLKAFFGNSSLSNNGHVLPNIVLFDDRVNVDQALLIYGALKNKVTYVQGPPGTGKTQTIFNTILSAFFAKKTVLISTNNNRPLDGIVEKLSFSYDNHKIPFPFLRLGNMNKIEETTLQIREAFQIEDEENDLSVNELEILRKKVLSKNREAVIALTNFQKRRVAEENLLFLEKVEKMGARSSIIKKQKPLLQKQIQEIPYVSEKDIISHFVSLKEDKDALKYLYCSSLKHLAKLHSPKYDALHDIVLIEDSRERAMKFNSFLSCNENLELLLDVFPLIFTTNISASRLGDGDVFFDLLIMDEAGQADIAHSLIPISRAKSLLLVGDEDQLNPVITLDENTNEDLKKEFQISDTYDYLANSILSTMKAADKVTNRVLLRNHYRCGKRIINFNNQYFYHNKLVVSPSLEEGNVSFIDSDNHVRTPVKNQNYEEAKNVVSYCKKNDISDCAIITPFVNQAKLINDLLIKNGVKEVKAATIHSVQGAEKNTIIIATGVSSFTSPRTIKWLNSHGEIANVAVSRAKKKLVVFGDEEKLKNTKTGDSVWNELIRYCKSKGTVEVIPSENDSLTIGKSNGSITEDEFYETIEQIVSIKKRLKVVRNLPIKELFEEYPNSQMEFDSVIYERGVLGGFKPCFAFEFDGGEHYSDAKRIESDKRKMKICEEHGIKLIRLPNSFSKDYEFLKKLIDGYKNNDDENEQLTLF